MNETKLFIVIADDDCIYAVKAKSKQESIDIVAKEQSIQFSSRRGLNKALASLQL